MLMLLLQRRIPSSTRALATAAAASPALTSTPRPRLEALRADTRSLDDFLSSNPPAKPERVVFSKSKQCVPQRRAFPPFAAD